MRLSPVASPSSRLRVGATLFVACLISLVSIGCTPSETLPPMAPVKGKATLDGAPLTAGHVVLHPEKVDPSAKVPPSAGTIDSSGNFEIFTGGKPGAPLGKYKVIVTPSMVPAQGGTPAAAKIDQKYMVPNQTPLSIDVVDSPKEGQYDLKLGK